ncbi:MAG TPA: GH3 auxin-responsive promoter family protein [Terriglobales bacterium]|nr:GH3 auxin-responsive promoter family protein [Terriglobales bacterium]
MEFDLKAAAFVAARQWQHWVQITKRPRDIQNHWLLDLLHDNRATRFGRDHHFDTVRSLADYRKQVRISDYECLRPYVEGIKNGESAVLTQEPISMFTMTSGSTGEPKLIPITNTCKKNHRDLTRLWYYRAYVDHSELMSGKVLGIVSPADEGRTPGGIPFGAASGLIYESSPRWIQNAYAVPYEVAQVKAFEAKYYLIMRLGLEHEVTFFATPNPSTILKLVETADSFKAEIIRDIRDGSIGTRWTMPPAIRNELTRGLAKNPARAQQLETIASVHGALRPRDYWPRLQLIGCWKGGTVGVRLKEFDRWFAPGTPVRDLGYMASEAQISLPISNDGSAGILAVDKNFYEFIPESEIDSAAPTVLACTDLEVGKYYYPILTTPGGLYRYDINDVIRVAGFYQQTPLIEFVRKGRDVANITGEKLHVNQVIQAFERAQSALGITVQHFRACAEVGASLYAFSVEFNGPVPAREELSRLLEELDGSLRGLNVEYAQKRESRRLGAPILRVMKTGWFERAAAASINNRARDVQFKAQLLTTTTEDPAEILFAVESA